MQKKCQCCGADMSGSRCGYCGFREIIDMDESGTELLRSLVSAHKKRLLKGITDISVVSYQYAWNAGKSALEQKAREQIKLADGEDCYGKVYWAKQEFGQLPSAKEVRFALSYRINGAERTMEVALPSVICDDFWKLGLIIDESLKLQVFLGTGKHHTVSEILALNLQ